MVYLAVNCLKEKVCYMLSKIYLNIPYTDRHRNNYYIPKACASKSQQSRKWNRGRRVNTWKKDDPRNKDRI